MLRVNLHSFVSALPDLNTVKLIYSISTIFGIRNAPSMCGLILVVRTRDMCPVFRIYRVLINPVIHRIVNHTFVV